MGVKPSEIEKMFVGFDKGKVQALDVYEDAKTKEWVLKYKDDQIVRTIKCESRALLDEILVEFGGKNPETCKTQSKFLVVDGSWMAKDLKDLGHRITKISVKGSRTYRRRPHLVDFPEETGSPIDLHTKKTMEDRLRVLEKHEENCSITRAFNEPTQFDNLVKFLLKDETAKELTYRVKYICTESIGTSQQCVWENDKAGDGTIRRVLELKLLDGVPFTACVRHHLFEAAGDMFDAPCKRVTVKKVVKSIERNICLFAAEDGIIDSTGKKIKPKGKKK